MSYLSDTSEEEKEIKEKIERITRGRKILFLGLSQSGKTSIVKTVFEGRQPEGTEDLDATVRFDRAVYNYKDQELYTFDVGGQTSYLEEAIETLKEHIFSDVFALFFVVDITDVGTYTLSRQYLLRVIRNVFELSDNPRIILFAHKMDLIEEQYKEEALRVFRVYFDLEKLESVELEETSIYDDSLSVIFKKIL
jgi:GTPase SAR1 family protein